jgi:predicted TPR repeat methyltransferase
MMHRNNTQEDDSMTQCNPLWKATYEADCPEKLAGAYKDWATDYDRDTVEGMGYVGPVIACRMLDNYLESKNSKILDAGCGTGLVGEILDKLGYSRMDAMDFSEDMLRVADEKSVYDKVFQADMNETLRIPDNSYDASICVGTFTYAHVGPEAFAELVRITRPGGFVTFTIRDGAYQEYGYRESMVELEAEECWTLEQMLVEDYLIKEDVTAKFCTYKVLED